MFSQANSFGYYSSRDDEEIRRLALKKSGVFGNPVLAISIGIVVLAIFITLGFLYMRSRSSDDTKNLGGLTGTSTNTGVGAAQIPNINKTNVVDKSGNATKLEVQDEGWAAYFKGWFKKEGTSPEVTATVTESPKVEPIAKPKVPVEDSVESGAKQQTKPEVEQTRQRKNYVLGLHQANVENTAEDADVGVFKYTDKIKTTDLSTDDIKGLLSCACNYEESLTPEITNNAKPSMTYTELLFNLNAYFTIGCNDHASIIANINNLLVNPGDTSQFDNTSLSIYKYAKGSSNPVLGESNNVTAQLSSKATPLAVINAVNTTKTTLPLRAALGISNEVYTSNTSRDPKDAVTTASFEKRVSTNYTIDTAVDIAIIGRQLFRIINCIFILHCLMKIRVNKLNEKGGGVNMKYITNNIVSDNLRDNKALVGRNMESTKSEAVNVVKILTESSTTASDKPHEVIPLLKSLSPSYSDLNGAETHHIPRALLLSKLEDLPASVLAHRRQVATHAVSVLERSITETLYLCLFKSAILV